MLWGASSAMPSFEYSADYERFRADAEYMEFLVAAGELLSSSLDYRATLKTVCHAAAQTIADICILEVGSINDRELIAAEHRDLARNAELERSVARVSHEQDRPAEPVWTVLDRGQTVFVPDIDEGWIDEHASGTRHAALMREFDYRSLIVVPVRSQIWGVTGTLTLVRTSSSERYGPDAVRFAEDLGRRCGVAIGKARLHSQTIDIAERFQKAALPHALPQLPGFTLDAFYEPADAALLVGGDWYDAFLLRNGDIGISVGDISGHGMESAALMSSTRNAIRMAMVIEPDLSAVLRHADFVFRNETAPDTLCTAAVAVIDRKQGTLTCASAGHPPPFIWSRGRITAAIGDPDLPLGCADMHGVPPSPKTVAFEPGATALFYTDGLVEHEKDYIAGEAALRSALSDVSVRQARSPARELRDRLVGRTHGDDISVLVVRREDDA